jgi:CBS domain-containing protein
MIAKDIMTTQVMTVKSDTSIKEAMKLLVGIEISGLIVTDDQNNIVGVVTERDLMVAYDFLKELKAPLRDYMNTHILSVVEDTPVEEISKLLVQGDIRRVPVLKDSKVVGVISRRDILKCILKNHDKHV